MPNADCVALRGVMTVFGEAEKTFEHSIKHTEWKQIGATHVRPPNHLNPVRRELALQVGFLSATKGEDIDFSQRLRPLLKKEVSAGDAPLYMYWYQPNA
jgi:hypothetical protein